MIKEFIPYEQALALKELGFDEPCFGRWIEPTELSISAPADDEYCQKQHEFTWTALAPLYQQALRWFREEHGLYADLFVDDDKTFGFMSSYFEEQGRVDLPIARGHATHEEARQTCLAKLIQICKNK